VAKGRGVEIMKAGMAVKKKKKNINGNEINNEIINGQ
jgi:hypothetical protein